MDAVADSAIRSVAGDDVEAFIDTHSVVVFRTARRFSASAEDAEDAYQRALEILLTKAPGDRAEWLPWMLTVVRNEALQAHRRQRFTNAESLHEIEVAAPTPSMDERVVNREETWARRDALSRIKSRHLRCLLLQADGLSCDAVQRVTGYSNTQVRRYIVEGRKALTTHLRRLESGAECLRVLPLLSDLADGEAGPEQTRDARLHLSACVHCRAVLREFRAISGEIAALFPLAPVAGDSNLWRQGSEYVGTLWNSLYERISASSQSVQAGGEITVAKKAAIVTAVAATLTAGGSQVPKIVSPNEAATAGADAQPTTRPSNSLPVFQLSEERTADRSKTEREPAAPDPEDVVSPKRTAHSVSGAEPDPGIAIAEPPAPVPGDPASSQGDSVSPLAPSTDADPAELLQP